jgi:uncharacterized RDD family membrane protein YckC
MSTALPDYATRPHYVGIVTRFVAFVIDAAIVTLIAFVVVGSVSLALSIFGTSIDDLPTAVNVIFGVAGWVLLNTAYFVGGWALVGQTVGQRAMRIRVQRDRRLGGRIGVWRGVVRLAGAVLAAVPLFAGYLPILFSDRRRGLHDWLARTVVVFDTEQKVVWGSPLQREIALERQQLQSRRGRAPLRGSAE